MAFFSRTSGGAASSRAAERSGSDMPAPVLSPEELARTTREILDTITLEYAWVEIEHVATRVTRVARNRVRMTNDGDEYTLSLATASGQRNGVSITLQQLDPSVVREAVQYAESLAVVQPGDPSPIVMPAPSRSFLRNTAWSDQTASAMMNDQSALVPSLIDPLVRAGYHAAAFTGMRARSIAYADKLGEHVAGRETDIEVTVTGRTDDGRGVGWAGQATRNWKTLDVAAVAQSALALTRLSVRPAAYEPGRRVAILGRPAMAQLIRLMAVDIDAMRNITPLFNAATGRPRYHERVLDSRITLRSDPNDPDGGYLPFTWRGYPLRAGTWVDHGILVDLPYYAVAAADLGVSPANYPPESIRMEGGPSSIEEMIASCEQGIYVNRLSSVEWVDTRSGLMTGVTNGGCFLVRNGKIDKPVMDFRFLDSPYFFLNKVRAIGKTERTAFGYTPNRGDWPIAPTIVPPVMVDEFNFIALADAV